MRRRLGGDTALQIALALVGLALAALAWLSVFALVAPGR